MRLSWVLYFCKCFSSLFNHFPSERFYVLCLSLLFLVDWTYGEDFIKRCISGTDIAWMDARSITWDGKVLVSNANHDCFVTLVELWEKKLTYIADQKASVSAWTIQFARTLVFINIFDALTFHPILGWLAILLSKWSAFRRSMAYLEVFCFVCT